MKGIGLGAAAESFVLRDYCQVESGDWEGGVAWLWSSGVLGVIELFFNHLRDRLGLLGSKHSPTIGGSEVRGARRCGSSSPLALRGVACRQSSPPRRGLAQRRVAM